MQTKLSVLCERIIELGWLAVAIVTPLFFNPFSQRIFEPDKIALLRSIVLLMLTAWLIRMVELGPSRGKREGEAKARASLAFLRIPLVIPTLILAGVYILTTITSISPRVSLWGSYERLQGTYTLLSYIVIFFLVIHVFRTREQLERLITVMLLVSLPISLYGIIQHYELDPIPWTETVKGRIFSSVGNPIFVAAYLIMVIPWTVKRLMDSLSNLLASGEEFVSPFISVTGYIFLLAAQLACIVFSKSRGPFIGLLGGMFFFFLLLAISKGRKGLALTVLALAVGVLLFLIVLNLPNTPLVSIREMPYIGRMGRVFGVETRTGRMRILIWQGALDMISTNPVRAMIGYGPECLYIAFHPYLLPELADMIGLGNTVDRCHNETFDMLLTSGLIGFAAYILLFGSLFYYSLKWLGLVENRRQQVLLWASLVVGGFLGLFVPWFIEGTFKFAGVGMPMGMVAALAVYVAASLLQREGESKDSYRQLMLITLFSGIVTHFMEIQFGIAVVSTRAYFWLYTALMVVVALFLGKEATESWKEGRRRRKKKKARTIGVQALGISSPWDTPLFSRSLSGSLILMIMGFAFINNAYILSAKGFSVPKLFLLTWLLSGLVIIGELGQKDAARGRRPKWLSYLVYYLLLSLGPFLLFLIFHIAGLSLSGDPATPIVIFYLCFLTAIIAIAAISLKGLSFPLWRRANLWFYLLLIVGMALLVFATNLNLIRADIYHNLGLAYGDAQQWDESVLFHRRALELAPQEDRYYFSLGQAYLVKAEMDVARRSHWLEKARKTMEQARRMSPLNPDHLNNLGYLYHYWAVITTDPAERIERLNRSLKYYRQVMAISPSNLGQLIRERVIEDYVLLGEAHMAMKEFDQAAEAYSQAIGMDPQSALQIGLHAVKESPENFARHCNLAMLYQQLERTDEAIAEVEKAKSLAPRKEQAELDRLMDWILAQSR